MYILRNNAMRAGLMMLAALVTPALAQTPGSSTRDGVFTAAQADRGTTLMNSRCAACHGQELTGGPDIPTLKGPAFFFTWKGKSLALLAEYVRVKMPPAEPASLTSEQAVDALAAILRANDAPAGAAELPTDLGKLAAIRFEP